jgi:hypothetical protein
MSSRPPRGLVCFEVVGCGLVCCLVCVAPVDEPAGGCWKPGCTGGAAVVPAGLEDGFGLSELLLGGGPAGVDVLGAGVGLGVL